jgi:hypothetical protein
MNNPVLFLKRFQRRSLLIGAAVALLLVYLGSWGIDAYNTRQEEVLSRRARLAQYRLVTSKADNFAERLTDLRQIKERAGRFFFTGEDDDKLSSAMQLRVQALVAKAGMQAESIRPMLQRTDGKQEKEGGGPTVGEVLIKARLAGTLAEFVDFMAELYRGEEFFAIESISIKPQLNKGLQIFIELKGFYVVPDQRGDSEEVVS